MTKEKLTYVSPETETLVVRFEGAILQTSKLGTSGFSEKGNITDRSGEDWGW